MSHTHRLFGMLLAFVLAMSGAITAVAQDDEATPAPAATLASATPAATPEEASAERGVPQIGEPVTVYGEDGREMAAITVEGVTDPYDDFAEFFTPEEGARYLAIDYTIENLLENDRVEFSPWDLSVMTAEGFLIGNAYVSLPDETDIIELESQDILGGESIQGTLFFAVPEDAELNGAYYNAYGYLVQLADLSDGTAERPAIGDPVTTVNETGEEVAELTITDYEDGFTDVDEFFTVEEGTRIVAVTVRVENLVENDRVEVSPFDFALQTEEGFLLSTSWVSLPDDTEIVELEDTDVLGGESVEGTIFFVVPDDLEVGGIYFAPESGLVFLIGDPAA